MRFNHILSIILLTMLWPGAQAQDISVGAITVSNSWSPALPPVVANGAAYFHLSNHEMKADHLISASTPLAERVEFHTSAKKGSMMVMEQMHTVEVPAHGNVAFQPGGMHLMLLGLQHPLVKGTNFPLTLIFKQAGPVTIKVRVRSPDGAANAPAMVPGMTPTMKHDKHQH